MKIEPFKMKVTPEQSKRVQEILFKNGYSWFMSGATNVKNLYSPYLYFTKSIALGETQPNLTKGDCESTFYNDGIAELTYQEFMDKYEFELPEKWCVKPETLEQSKLVGKWFDKYYSDTPDQPFYENSGVKDLYFANNEPMYVWGYGPRSGFTEITFEQFKKYVLKEETMDKKIIGYKLIKPEFEGAAIQITQFISTDFAEFMLTAGDRGYASRLRHAGVLDLWFEPVYEEEKKFNVGDWVTYIEGGIPPYTTQIQSIGHDGWIRSNINKPDGGHYHYSQYRKATSDEIKKVTKYKIGDWITIEDSSKLQSGCKGCPEGTFQIVPSPTLDWKGLDQYDNGFFVQASNGIWKISNIGVRKATPEEIEAAQVVKMPFGDIEVVVTPNLIVSNIAGFSVTWSEIYELMKSLSSFPKVCGYTPTLNKSAIINIG